MKVPFYDIKAQYDELQAPMDAAVHEVISTGAYVMGKYHNALEKELAEYHGCKHGIAVNSGTDALRIMMDAVGIGAGDEVITTAFTFVASVETIMQTGATPVFIDIDPATFQMDPNLIEAAITPHTKAILPIHLFGQLADIRRIKEIADKHNLILLEDAAQALGSHNNGEYAGQFGVAAGFSFYVTKNLGAAGDGGLIMTNDDAIAERSKSMRVHGMGRERYYYDHLGYTSRLAEVQAAVLHVKFTKFEEWNSRRLELAKTYFEILEGSSVVLPALLSGNNTTWHQFTIRSSRRDELQEFLKQREVGSMIYYPVPIHFHEPYAHLANGKGSLPITEQVSEECLSLPIHQHMSQDQVAFAATCIKEFAGSAVTA
ncbi:MAG: DegT/DnrJ/EryC1/StrS family aminotransferase [Fimbriimonadaceae bacterium]|nr:DegT/DnrJ/EryC1/StrS family aminotransferase [Fimbriimonadaceae bacterium]